MRRSSSVIVARTRMCLRTVAIIRGGNFCGAAWHRPQLAWNRFSPSIRIESLSDACTTATPVAASFFAAEEPANTDVASASRNSVTNVMQ